VPDWVKYPQPVDSLVKLNVPEAVVEDVNSPVNVKVEPLQLNWLLAIDPGPGTVLVNSTTQPCPSLAEVVNLKLFHCVPAGFTLNDMP
jgi:hypothetical protein